MSLYFEIKTIEETPSTNLLMKEWAENGKVKQGTVLRTLNQFAGVGQSGNSWESESGKNLTFSLFLQMHFLEASEVFMLNKLISLSIYDYLMDKELKNVKIKWPNDIYVGDKKIAGMLTHNSFLGDKLEYCIVGVGLNINQTAFLSNAPNPISLKQISGNIYDLDKELNLLLGFIKKRYVQKENERCAQLNEAYLKCLYGIGEKRTFLDRTGTFTGIIHGIDSYGRLLIEKVSKQSFTYDVKEITFL